MIYKMYYHYDPVRKEWGRWGYNWGELEFEPANHDAYDDYPKEADLFAVYQYEDYDKNYPYNEIDNNLYYGYKECKKLGLEYDYPDPRYNNNAD